MVLKWELQKVKITLRIIGWLDVKADEHSVWLNTIDEYEQNQIIVVDKKDGGSSLMVEGAVDMVPKHNTLIQRRKLLDTLEV